MVSRTAHPGDGIDTETKLWMMDEDEEGADSEEEDEELEEEDEADEEDEGDSY